MAKYLIVPKSLFTEFRAVNIEQVGRDLNSHVDALANLASVFGWEVGRTIAVKVISAPSLKTQQKSILTNYELGQSWMDPIVSIMQYDKLLDDKKEAHKIRVEAARCWISPSGDLCKRSYLEPYLLCVQMSLVEKVHFEIHEGVCRLHLGEDHGPYL